VTYRASEDVERFCVDAHPKLVAALTHQFGEQWLAEDLAQEALIRACDRWAVVRELDSPVGWTFRVGVNLGRSHFRRRAAERRACARQGRAADAAVHRDPDVADRLGLQEALAALTWRQRQVVVLRFFLGLPAGEVATVLSTTEGAVRALTHRAIAVLRASLDEPFVAEEVPDVS